MSPFSFKNFIIPSYLFYLLPLGLVTGPFLPDLFLSLIAILFLINCYFEKNFKFLKFKFSLIFLFFYSVILISSILSNNILFSLESSLFFLRYLFFTYGIYYLCKNRPETIDIFFKIVFSTVLLVVVDGYFEFIFGKNILGTSSPDPSRILSFFHAMIIGSFLSKTLPLIFIFLILTNKNTNYSNLIYFFIIAIYILIFLSGERSAFLHASIIFIFLSILIKQTRKLFFFTFSLILIIFTFLILTNEVIKNRMITSVYEGFQTKQVENTSYNDKIIIFSPVHDKFVRVSGEIFLDNKLIGSGPNTFRIVCSKYSNIKFNNNSACGTHPHNTYAQLLAETGSLGFAIVLSIFLYISYNLFKSVISMKHDQNTYFKVCLLTYFFIILFPFTPTGNLFNNWIGAIYFLPLGLFLTKFVKNE